MLVTVYSKWVLMLSNVMRQWNENKIPFVRCILDWSCFVLFLLSLFFQAPAVQQDWLYFFVCKSHSCIEFFSRWGLLSLLLKKELNFVVFPYFKTSFNFKIYGPRQKKLGHEASSSFLPLTTLIGWFFSLFVAKKKKKNPRHFPTLSRGNGGYAMKLKCPNYFCPSL